MSGMVGASSLSGTDELYYLFLEPTFKLFWWCRRFDLLDSGTWEAFVGFSRTMIVFLLLGA